MTKTGDRLTFDFTGTAAQARGAINCTRVGLESGVYSAILPMLCYDIPWSPAGLGPHVEIVSEEGTINNARHPAAVSMATVQATFATSHVTFAAIAKMIACSELSDEIQANWAPAWHGMTMAGRHAGHSESGAAASGRPFTSVLLDCTGGSGARGAKDGLDAGGLAGSPAMAIGNVETYEKEAPILYVYRSLAVDTGGHGLTRGGCGMQAMIIPHGNDGPIDLTAITHGVSQPESPGLLGGSPSSVQVRLLLRDTRLAQMFAAKHTPTSCDEVVSARVDVVAAKQRTLFNPGDAVLTVCAGGAGYGDPIDRAPDAVVRDVANGCVSSRAASDIYGVAITESATGPALDKATTDTKRASIRAARLAQSKPVSEPLNRSVLGPVMVQGRVGHALAIVASRGRQWFVCGSCEHPLSDIERDPKHGALWREVPMATYSDWNRYGLTAEIRVREFCCPSCAHLIAVQVALKDDPILFDMTLTPTTSALAAAAE